jgi:hypothetical protein
VGKEIATAWSIEASVIGHETAEMHFSLKCPILSIEAVHCCADAPYGSALQVTIEPAVEPGREVIRILVIGSAHGVDRIVHELYRLGFAEVRWGRKPQPTGRINEIMRVLTRYVMVE